jgi:hypothetical protein
MALTVSNVLDLKQAFFSRGENLIYLRENVHFIVVLQTK